MSYRRRLNAVLAAWMCVTCRAAQPESRPARMTITVTPAATGEQLVRASIPFRRLTIFPAKSDAIYLMGPDGISIRPTCRDITGHAPTSDGISTLRRGIFTFPYTFTSTAPVTFTLGLPRNAAEPKSSVPLPEVTSDDWRNVEVVFRDGTTIKAKLLAPEPTQTTQVKVELVECDRYFIWERYVLNDPQWQQVIEMRADAMGTVALIAHLQRNVEGDGRAPDFGWELTLPNSQNAKVSLESGQMKSGLGKSTIRHAFKDGASCVLSVGDAYRVYHPAAPLRRRGFVEAKMGDTPGEVSYRYWRCRADEKVPMQQAAWHRAEVVIAPVKAAALTPTLGYPHVCRVDSSIWDELYPCKPRLTLKPDSPLARLLAYHRDAVVHSACVGDDWGNVTAYNDGVAAGPVMGMNRLNHCPAIFFDAYRSGDRRLLDTAVNWCDNFYDQTIWWGPGATGGTRYCNIIAMQREPLDNDRSYMWRSNGESNFCTKGYDSFLLAYEETGDPRMMAALDAQVNYAKQNVFADHGECRNIGDVADFVHLYEFTGEKRYLNEAIRLFRELRTKLSTGDLFDQGGKPLKPDPPFVDDDAAGVPFGYAKPYIIGYALNGLPALARYYPDEPKLRDVVQAVADFLADSQDPLGGWRYPHPSSSTLLLSMGMENAWQITNAAKLLGPHEKYLDAIERVLRQRLHGWLQTGKVPGTLSGWELATGRIKTQKEIYTLYKRPSDRDPQRDYREGAYTFGSSPPEGVIYFAEVLAYYLQHRPESRLLAPPAPDEPLGQMLGRAARDFPTGQR